MNRQLVWLPLVALGATVAALGQVQPSKVGVINIQSAIISTKDGQKAAAELAAKYGDAILESYERMDRIVGEVERAMKPGGTLIIVSDHGFHSFRKGFNTNTWLVQNGYMALKHPGAEEKTYNLENLFGQGSFFPNVD